MRPPRSLLNNPRGYATTGGALAAFTSVDVTRHAFPRQPCHRTHRPPLAFARLIQQAPSPARASAAVGVGLLLLVVLGCAPQSPDHSSWIDQADQSLKDVTSEVATVELLLRLEADGKVPGKYQQVVAQDSETAVGATLARFGGEQPPRGTDASYRDVTGAMSDASDLLVEVRVAIVRRDTAAYPGLQADLEETRSSLEGVRRDLR